MVDDPDAELVFGWMKKNGRYQDWRALDKNGRPRVYRKQVCELSRNKLRIVLNLPSPRFDAAMKTIFEGGYAVPLGRMLPIESNQAVELWLVNR